MPPGNRDVAARCGLDARAGPGSAAPRRVFPAPVAPPLQDRRHRSVIAMKHERARLEHGGNAKPPSSRDGDRFVSHARFSIEQPQLALEALVAVGIEHTAWQRAATFSGGQQQRAALARCLVQRAKVIRADEPIASLDPIPVT